MLTGSRNPTVYLNSHTEYRIVRSLSFVFEERTKYISISNLEWIIQAFINM